MQTSESVVVETSISSLRCSSASLASPSPIQSLCERSMHCLTRSSELNMSAVSWRQNSCLFIASVRRVQFWSGLARQMPAVMFLADAALMPCTKEASAAEPSPSPPDRVHSREIVLVSAASSRVRGQLVIETQRPTQSLSSASAKSRTASQ
jgi:hypothetical protein